MDIKVQGQLEKWLSGLKYLPFLQRTKVQFQHSHWTAHNDL